MARRGRGEGSIHKRSRDSKWVAVITLPTGKRKSYVADTRQEAQRKLAGARRDLDAGLPLVAEKQSVAAYFRSWLEIIEPTMEENSWIRHEKFVRIQIIPSLGHLSLVGLTAQHVQSFYAKMLKGGLASTTVNHLHGTVHKALGRAVNLGLLARNVSEQVDVPRVQTEEMRPLSRDQARVLIEATQSDRMAALYALAISTGMREGELLGLRWSTLDLNDRVLRVRGNLQRTKRTESGWVIKVPKTKRSRRQIALSEEDVTMLRSHQRRHREERLFVGPAWLGGQWDLVFCSQLGEPLHARTIVHQFKRHLKKAGLPDVRFHDLRHTCATLLLSARVNPKVVSELLGHASVSITLDLYSHVIPDMQQDAAETMGRMLYG